jgi:Spy/CpxP family protein refolding chaperone
MEWWKDPLVVQKLHVNDDQIRKLDKIAQDHEIEAIDLLADLEKQNAIFRFQMQTDAPVESHVLAQLDKVTQARARLEKSQVEMLLAVRRVLTAEQARIVRDLQRRGGPPRPGFGPPRGGPEEFPEGGPCVPRHGLPEPPPNGEPG